MNSFLRYFKNVYAGMGIWQALNVAAGAVLSEIPLLLLLAQALLIMLILVVPSLIITALLYWSDKK